MVPSVSSVQKYKYMLSLLFSRFVHISRTYRTQKKVSVPKNAPVLPCLCWSFAYFCSVGPAPFHPGVAGWCRFVVGCLLDGFCINNKGFSTVGGHWSQRVNKTPTSVRFTVATADPSWVCNGAGGGISGGKKHKLNILLTPVGSISICSLPNAQMGNIGAVLSPAGGKTTLNFRLPNW